MVFLLYQTAPQVIIPLAVTVGILRGQLRAAHLEGAVRGLSPASASGADDLYTTLAEEGNCRSIMPTGDCSASTGVPSSVVKQSYKYCCSNT
jgi:hypothetical protein